MADSVSTKTCTDARLAPLSGGGIGLVLGDDANGGISVPLPFASRICLIEHTHVAGTTHVKEINCIVEGLVDGQELRLERDKGNLQDRWAIKVFAGEDRIGFVSCDNNEMLARMMDGGKRILGKLTYREKLGTWNKLHMEVYLDD